MQNPPIDFIIAKVLKKIKIMFELENEIEIIENDDLIFPDEKIRMIHHLENEARRYANEENEPAEFKDSW